jgi:hypothetical protein
LSDPLATGVSRTKLEAGDPAAGGPKPDEDVAHGGGVAEGEAVGAVAVGRFALFADPLGVAEPGFVAGARAGAALATAAGFVTPLAAGGDRVAPGRDGAAATDAPWNLSVPPPAIRLAKDPGRSLPLLSAPAPLPTSRDSAATGSVDRIGTISPFMPERDPKNGGALSPPALSPPLAASIGPMDLIGKPHRVSGLTSILSAATRRAAASPAAMPAGAGRGVSARACGAKPARSTLRPPQAHL